MTVNDQSTFITFNITYLLSDGLHDSFPDVASTVSTIAYIVSDVLHLILYILQLMLVARIAKAYSNNIVERIDEQQVSFGNLTTL